MYTVYMKIKRNEVEKNKEFYLIFFTKLSFSEKKTKKKNIFMEFVNKSFFGFLKL